MRFPVLALAQVEAVHPGENALSVNFPNYAMLNGTRVVVSADRATGHAGTFSLPTRGSWGLVSFYQDDARSGVWTRSLSDNVTNAVPIDLFMDDPLLLATIYHDLGHHLHFSSGDDERVLPDGTLIRFTHTKNGALSNIGLRDHKTHRTEGYYTEDRDRQRREPPASAPPVDIVIAHSSGASVVISADGRIDVATPRGHHLKLHDATEKVRLDMPPYNVIQIPEEDDNRKVSEIQLMSEIGAYLRFHDDPIEQKNRYVELKSLRGHTFRMQDKIEQNVYTQWRSALGHEIFMRDKIDEDRHLTLTTAAGHVIELRDTPDSLAGVRITTNMQHQVWLEDGPPDSVHVKHRVGSVVRLAPDTNVYVTAVGAAIIEGGDGVKLGSAGASRPVARVGDIVNLATGVITSGADNVFSD